jgi:hypothetical protein
MFDKKFFDGLVDRVNEVNRHIKELCGSAIFSGAPAVEVVLRDGVVLRIRSVLQESEDGVLTFLVYMQRGNGFIVAWLHPGEIIRVDAFEPANEKRLIGFAMGDKTA